MSPAHAAVVSTETLHTLRGAWHALTAQQNLRTRDAAQKLGVSEAQLLATGVGAHVTRLTGDLRDLMMRIGELGKVQAQTRNEAAVHEKVGAYTNITHGDQVGLVLGDAIDLRLLYDKWAFGYAVEEKIGQGTRRSFQFFDAFGDVIHTIYLRDNGDIFAFEALRDAWAAPIQISGETVLPHPAGSAPERPDDAVDAKAFAADWRVMTETPGILGLLKKHKLSRTQAFRLIGSEFAIPLLTDAPARLLQAAARIGQEIMVFVGNPGCIQIHAGPVQNVQRRGNWLSVLDPDFSLHLREDRVAQAWLVRKPTTDGIVTSVELLDAAGELIACFFDKRTPGFPETTGWRMLASSLEPC
ncbi:hemin-degrading factor [Thiobacillus denitrificans]|uniref:hemin-degrading factor n=1 Tax=Thiobacillus denitrificans TaxID=36861 RepID=UPI00036BE811|nr:hemin-degrading factor [Thiobacillus denitrificans]